MGAALVRDGRVLAARRAAPPQLAGHWELPGGKVEPGESPESALVREVAEELGCGVEVVALLPGESEVRAGLTLRVAVVRLVAGEPVPRAADHDAVRWLGPDELDRVSWLAPDVPFLAPLREVLQGRDALPLHAVLYEEDDARAVADRLVADGFAAEVVRERLAGEDDDEDHPWAVLTDAPEFLVEVVVEPFDGWVDHGEPAGAPLELPDGPRRHKGHFPRD